MPLMSDRAVPELRRPHPDSQPASGGHLCSPIKPTSGRHAPYTQIVEHDMYMMARARSASDAARLVARLHNQLVALDPSKQWADVRLMQDIVRTSESVAIRRFALILLGIFAGVA